MRHLVLVPCLLALACTPIAAGEPAPAAPVSAVSASERASIDAVVAAMIAAGVPDTRGATLVIGTVEVSEPAPEKPTTGLVPKARRINPTRIADGKKITTWQGVHAHLADGRWLVGLETLVVPTTERTISVAADSKRLATTAEIDADFAANKQPARVRPTQDEQEKAWFDVYDAQTKPRVEAARKAMQHLDRMGLWDDPIRALMLYRAGVPGTIDAIFIIAQMRQMPLFRLMVQQRRKTLIFDQQHDMWSNVSPTSEDEDSSLNNPAEWMRKRKGSLGIADPSTMLRESLATWFNGMLFDSEQRAAFGFTTQDVAKHALSFTPESERTALRTAMDRLVAALALPEQAPADADLATRLQWWEFHGRSGLNDDDSEQPMPDEAAIAQLSAEMQAHMRKELARRKAWRPAPADIPALIALLDDQRPSRWIDGIMARTVGDNALRALFALMRVDPRLLAGCNPSKPWTDAERSACAVAIAGWWKAQGNKPLSEALTAELEKLPLHAATIIISTRKPEERAALLDRLARVLPTTPNTAANAMVLAKLLLLADDHAGIAAKIAGWPVSGQLRPLLAVWNDRQNRPAELDKLLDELTAAGNADDKASGSLSVALQQAMQKPAPPRLQRCLALAAGPLNDRRTWAALGAACNQGHSFSQEWMPVYQYRQSFERMHRGGNDEQNDPALAIPLVVICTMLGDTRPLPADAYTIKQNGHWGHINLFGLNLSVQLYQRDPRANQQAHDQPPKPDPKGLRVCDLAAVAARSMIYRTGNHELGNTSIDLWAEAAVRDTTLHELRSAFADAGRAACTAAKLPDVLPAAAPPDTKALF